MEEKKVLTLVKVGESLTALFLSIACCFIIFPEYLDFQLFNFKLTVWPFLILAIALLLISDAAKESLNKTKRLYTIEDIKKNGHFLGMMTEGSYNLFIERAETVGEDMGIRNPVLGLAIYYKPGVFSYKFEKYDGAYPISQKDWKSTLDEINWTIREVPEVYLIDRDKYSFA